MGSGGRIITIVVDKGFQQYDIVLIEVEHLNGSATSTRAEFSTDSTFTNPTSRIGTFSSINHETPLSSTNYARFFPWNDSESGGEVYCKLTADTEVDNDYYVAIHIVGGS